MTSVRGQKFEEGVDSDLFAGITFCEPLFPPIPDSVPVNSAHRSDIIKGDSENNKTALEALVHKHGGDYTQAQLSDNSAIPISSDEKGECRDFGFGLEA